MLINPGPAISTRETPAIEEIAACKIVAISRGFFPAAFANCSAIEVA